MDDSGSIQTEHIMETYLKYLENVLTVASNQKDKLERLYTMMDKKNTGAIHIYGFGRSGSAALSLAIRLRHFCEFLPPVWWVGDQVRMPICQGDVVILFSSSGKREEVKGVADKAKKVGATIVLITAQRESQIGADAKETFVLPTLKETFVYGGGDFELAAYLLQEIIVAEIGTRYNIPKDMVDKYHV